MTTFILVMLAGGVGAAARFVVDGVIARLVSRGPFPLGILVINIVGSLVLGVVTGLASGSVLSLDVARVLGRGLCGGFTTFSTASLESVKFWAEEGMGPAAAYTGVSVAGAIAAVWAGLAITTAL